jgi:hypothetical protein
MELPDLRPIGADVTAWMGGLVPNVTVWMVGLGPGVTA